MNTLEYTYICMSHVYTCIHVCVCAFIWWAEIDCGYLLLIFPSVFDTGSFYWIWCLISDWLASQPQGSTCLYVCSTGITGLCLHVGCWGERNWGCELKHSYLCSKQLTHKIISSPWNHCFTLSYHTLVSSLSQWHHEGKILQVIFNVCDFHLDV